MSLLCIIFCFFFQAEDGIRDLVRSRGLGDVYKRQDKVWLYGSSEATIAETVTGGRSNRMPAFEEFLGDAKVHLLSAYVLGLSSGAK